MNGLQSGHTIEQSEVATTFTSLLEHQEADDQQLEALKELRRRIKQCRSQAKMHRLERDDDAFLLRFLRARRFEVDESLELLCQYLDFRKKNPSLFQDYSASQLHHILEDGFPCVLPHNDANGAKMMVIFAGGWDKDSYGTEDILKAIVLSIERLIENEEVQLNGVAVIADFSGWTTAHASQLKLQFLRNVYYVFQDHFPVRFRGIHFVNEPWYLRAGLTVFKPFIKDKIWERIHVHGNNMATLHTHFHPDVLPAEFGGNKPEVNQSYWASLLLDSEKTDKQNYVYGNNPFKWAINQHEEEPCRTKENIPHEVRV